MDVSLFRPVAIGVVAENKALRSRKILVTPTETLGFLNGEVASNQMTLDFSGVDESGNQKEGSVSVDNTVEATWLPFGSNRFSAPDVRRSERVQLLQMADQDKYYWRVLGLDDDKRALETVIFAINANPNETGRPKREGDDDSEGDHEFNVDTHYFVEWSSHAKHLILQTSQANNELCGYQFHLDTGNGTFNMEDTIGNFGSLNSGELTWMFQTAAGCYLTLEKETMRGYAPKIIDLTAGTQLLAKVGSTSVDLTPNQMVLSSANVAVKQA